MLSRENDINNKLWEKMNTLVYNLKYYNSLNKIPSTKVDNLIFQIYITTHKMSCAKIYLYYMPTFQLEECITE